MKTLTPIIVLIFCSGFTLKETVNQDQKPTTTEEYVAIGHGAIEFIPPHTFVDLETNIQSEFSATTFIGSKTYDTQITFMSKVLPKEIATSYNSIKTQAPEGVVKSTPFATKFGNSQLHYSPIQIIPGSISHEFNTVINTSEVLLMILCYSHSGDEKKVEKLERALIESFQTIREVR